jgi:hypothetical protein
MCRIFTLYARFVWLCNLSLVFIILALATDQPNLFYLRLIIKAFQPSPVVDLFKP